MTIKFRVKQKQISTNADFLPLHEFVFDTGQELIASAVVAALQYVNDQNANWAGLFQFWISDWSSYQGKHGHLEAIDDE